jgi:hypothetical protein
MDLIRCFQKLRIFEKVHNEVMITGGEPTLSRAFKEKVLIGRLLFGDVFLTTSNAGVLNIPPRFVKRITFSLHGRDPEKFYVEHKRPVFASILDHQYTPDLPYKLRRGNFRGLTINEDQRGEGGFDQELPDLGKTFSYKVNRKGHCLDDFVIVFPDMSLTESFREYL